MSTKIEWTDVTWNPVTGCTKVSPGCDRCYAETMHERFNGKGSFAEVTLHEDRLQKPLRLRTPKKVFVNSMSDLFHADVPDEFIARVFAVMAWTPQHTYQILTKRHARMCSLLSSAKFQASVRWFHEAREDMPTTRFPAADLDVDAPGDPTLPLPNVWLGVSIESQKWAGIRIPALLDTPAAVRWISAEPLLGPVDLVGAGTKQKYWLTGEPVWGAPETDGRGNVLRPLEVRPRLDWVVVGGESGHGARPMHPQWARGIRDQCVAAGVPFLFKQWGEWGPAPWVVRVCDPAVGWQGTDVELAAAKVDAEARGATHVYASWANEYGHDLYKPPHKPWSLERADPLDAHQAPMRRWGKGRAGRELDGRTWDEYPAVTA